MTTPTPPDDRPRNRATRRGLVPIIVVVAAVLMAAAVFAGTRSSENYQEDQRFGPDPVETST